MTEIVNKFEYRRNLLLNNKILRGFADSSLHLCGNSEQYLKYVLKNEQYGLPLYKVPY